MFSNALPEDVLYILKTLNQAGYEAYIVGGCVRDSLLHTQPKDWDITTSAKPEETKRLFSHTFDTGIQHGTVTVVLNHVNYEVTTYRIEGDYTDCRRPSSVSFTKILQEDLLRRDFTMNAIAYHPEEGYQDFFHGMEDIRSKTIRGVGEPALRFQEDALRMLRCVRFAAQLGFTVETETYNALCENKELIQKISVERIHDELQKLWLCVHEEKMPLLWESGLLAQIDPLLSERLMQGETAFLAYLGKTPKNPILRWTIILQDYTVQEARIFLKKFKFDNDSQKQICLLLENLKEELPTEGYPLRALGGKLGVDTVRQLITLQEILRPTSSFSRTAQCLDKILADGDCLTLKQLTVDGQMLMELGVPKGKELGSLLAVLLDLVQRDPQWNQREFLLEKAKELV
ncbi:MAG: CCA tRNA nucleotidyltransferase [Clostridia bacterium]|nr:CCA tRNA nucleotidyltransferase [Clostridia bacterium]